MPLYFLNVRNGHSIGDPEGIDLPDDDAARLHAKSVAHDLGRRSGLLKEWRLILTSEDGRVLAELHLKDFEE
jgi:hypothetical protein